MIVVISGFVYYILHVCGGDPSTCFKLAERGIVFSTYVEVIPVCGVPVLSGAGILHVCGGDPSYGFRKSSQRWYSPRMWR